MQDLSRDIPAIEAAYQDKSVETDSNQLLSWEQINLDYWLPQPPKALANAYSIEKLQEVPDPKQWNKLQKTLLTRYGIPEHISADLNAAGLLDASEKGQLIWHKRSLLNSKNSHFWFEINESGERVEKMVVTSSPVEAVSAYLVDRLMNKEDRPCLYLSLDRSEQFIELDLTEFDTVVVNSRDKQFIPDRVSNLVIQENVSSWHQS